MARSFRPARFRPTLMALEARDLPSVRMVTTATGSGTGSFSQVVTTAFDGDIVRFDPSLTDHTISLPGTVTIGRNITIEGLGSDHLTLSGNNVGTALATTALNLVIDDLTITRGGTAGVNNSGTLTLDRCTITGNHGGTGGGVYNTGTMTLNACVVSNNTAGTGGGLHNGGRLTLNDCQVLSNTATNFGGGTESSLSGATLVVNRTLYAYNQTTYLDGGAIYSQGTVTITDSTLVANQSGNFGGGMINGDGSNLILLRSTIAYNTAVKAGGGIYSTARATISDSTIASNLTTSTLTGTTGGGGIAATGAGPLTLTGCTIAYNGTNTGGGGLEVLQLATARLTNTIVADNVAGTIGPDAAGMILSQGYNLIGVSTGSAGWTGTDLLGSGAAPLDPRLGSLNDNGGPTKTIALLTDSPAIGAAAPLTPAGTDQRGVARSSAPSIGAVEYVAGAIDHLRVLTVGEASAGDVLDVTVRAEDAYGNLVVTYAGTAHFSSGSTLWAGLPDDYTFTTADAGSHTFVGGLTFIQAGTQTVTVTDTSDGTLTGSTTVTIDPLAAAYFLITAPDTVTAGEPFTIAVSARDAYGNVATSYTGAVQFGSTDPQASDLGSHTFTVTDQGSFTLTGVILQTSGPQTLFAFDGTLGGGTDLVVM